MAALVAGVAMVACASAQAAPAKKGVAHAPAAAPAPDAAPKGPPKLIVAIAVDQYSADLFAEYREHYTGGLARLLKGAVFPSGFQSHAATETCPGHSTILTGVHPARTGIIANTWYDLNQTRPDKRVYCAENEADPASSPFKPVVSTGHLKVPTLGEWVKKQWPDSRNVAVSVKDRAVAMMGGHDVDAAYWLVGDGFTSYRGRDLSPVVVSANERLKALLAKGAPAFAVPAWCVARDRAVQAGALTVGTGRFPIEPGTTSPDLLRTNPRADAATLEVAAGLLSEMKLGKGAAPDVLSVSLSANDYIGHGFGTEGLEMCIQQQQLDAKLGEFFAKLDASGVDYAVVLTADHGGIDMPERLREQGVPEAARAEVSLNGATLGRAIAEELGIAQLLPACTPGDDVVGNVVCSDGLGGDYWISPALTAAMRAKVSARLVDKLKAHPQVEAVFTREQIEATAYPIGHPQDWSQLQKIRASYDPVRSGDVYAVLKRAVVAVPTPKAGSRTVTTHGSIWDYDRRVPILFWRRGVAGLEQPQPVETVDIAPTLAALIGLQVPQGSFDGRCLDIDGGVGNSCQ